MLICYTYHRLFEDGQAAASVPGGKPDGDSGDGEQQGGVCVHRFSGTAAEQLRPTAMCHRLEKNGRSSNGSCQRRYQRTRAFRYRDRVSNPVEVWSRLQRKKRQSNDLVSVRPFVRLSVCLSVCLPVLAAQILKLTHEGAARRGQHVFPSFFPKIDTVTSSIVVSLFKRAEIIRRLCASL